VSGAGGIRYEGSGRRVGGLLSYGGANEYGAHNKNALDNSSLASQMFAEGVSFGGTHVDRKCNSAAAVHLIVTPEFLVLPKPGKSIFRRPVTSRRRNAGGEKSPKQRASGIGDRIEEDESLCRAWSRSRRRNAIPYRRIGKYVRFTQDDLKQIISSGEQSKKQIAKGI
jgi:hypothetical protein